MYPQALERLARDYRFCSIGGACCRAIAAGLAAAAEYRRQTKRDAEGFALLNELPSVLGSSKNGNPLCSSSFNRKLDCVPSFGS